ncbi:hypothetical protein GCM10011611_59950 [Aliidongia dinghuensis]|uniref:SPOR domain-containing protein n=1 Tax=Aliidongia dinghuensis TaxID=1867774 RepID=A0A8J2Z098_9PROT|nr:SPOR domain-containing protein [Aliidongia dinghuensis]GGF45523.1 hypothetical protein GCM10011611_59950 [Aliidongia dinghuensis]
MQGFGQDRTLSTGEWRTLILAGCGILVVGLGLGLLIGRLSAAPPAPPPASASILPESIGLPDSDPTLAESAPPEPARHEPASAEATTAAPAAPLAAAAPAPAPPPVVQEAATRPPPPIATGDDTKPRERVQPAVVPPKPKPARKMAAKTAAKPAPAPIESPHGVRWVVQLGAFQSSDHANLLVNTLAAHGQPARVRFANGWFFVQTPPYRSATAAKGAAQALAAREHLPTYLIKLPAPPN